MALNPIVDSRDVRFIVFELLETDKLAKYEKFQDLDKDTLDEVINLAETIAVEQVYPVNAETDKQHAQYNPDTQEVIIPKEFTPGLDAYYEAGFLGLAIDPEAGGMGMPDVMFQVATDYFTAASVSFSMYPALSIGAFNLVKNFYDGDDREAIMDKVLTGEWGGTMCLTEPDAGSDVGALKSKASLVDGKTYNVTGQKIFISAGDNDYYKNMIHPVLARVEGDPAGTKGISIFMTPKYKVNADGSCGDANDVICSGIEHKMGITAQATCTLNFGDEKQCEGVLMGEQRKGMKIMFQMMNEARLYVGLQGMSCASAAYMHAVTYAKNRVQGAHVTQMTNPEAKGVPIIQHPDVKRMLLSMKSRVEAMRTLSYYLGYLIDITHVEDGETKKEAQALADFLIPINKAGNTDGAWDVASDAIQVYGGYGFCSDYPVEQYARDAKILAIYEGTNGIQSLDLTMRKLLMNENQYNYSVFKKKIAELCEKAKGVVDDTYIETMERAVAKMDEVVEFLKGNMAGGKFLHIFANATPLQQAFSMLTYAWMHLWGLVQATPKMKELVGDKKGADREAFLNDNMEAAYYSGRVLSGQFYIGAELQKYFGKCDYILKGESAVVKTSDAIFTGALEE
ncbi:MAG: acyl-CoA dehydrogenase [bacterium]|nr:acyl-CoA dehydrogenase [bacterium]